MRAPLHIERIFVIWSCIRSKDQVSRNYNWKKSLSSFPTGLSKAVPELQFSLFVRRRFYMRLLFLLLYMFLISVSSGVSGRLSYVTAIFPGYVCYYSISCLLTLLLPQAIIIGV